MIGIDTNVVVRLLVGDDEPQQRAAREFLIRRSSAEDPAWINRVAIVETVWVLEQSYRYTRRQIAEALERLLNTAELAFENQEQVREAVSAYRDGAGFADTLVAIGNANADCATTVTFDAAAAKRSPYFTLL